MSLCEKKKVLKRALELGHNHNPADPSSLTLDDIDKVDVDHPEAVKVIRSFQAFMSSNLNEFVAKHHPNRIASIDGDIGPATIDLANMMRCGFPDYMPAGREEANWPGGCRGDIQIGRIFEQLPGSTREDTDKIWWASCNNWTQALVDLEMFSQGFVNSTSGLQLWSGLKALGGSTLAWSFLAQNSCQAKLEQRFNTRVNWAKLAFSAAVKTHEDGHAIGLPHNDDRDALMYPAIHDRSIARRGYPNDTDLRGCKAIGYQLSGLDQMPEEQLWYPRNDDPTIPPPDPWDPSDPTGKLPTSAKYYFGTELIKEVKFG